MGKKIKGLVLLVIVFLMLPIISIDAKEKDLESSYSVKTEKEIYYSTEEDPDKYISYDKALLYDEGNIKTIEKEYESLVKKTSAKYEIVMAKGNKTYTYKDKASTYDEAVNKANKIRKENPEDFSSVPAVIDSEGVITYATESIGRIWREYKPGYSGTRDALTYVYSDSALINDYTYINDSYISEVPIIENRTNEAKVLINGYEGWVNKNINRAGHKDLRVVPVTDVNYSCNYYVKSGMLYHRIVTSITSGAGSTQLVGVAPSYLSVGKKYVSYDEKYFYDATNLHQGLINLQRDLQEGNKSRAVNKGNPYYAYYKYLPFRTKTNYTASEINNFIENNTSYNSKLRGTGQAFIDAQNKYGVNALLALSVSINESAWGTSKMALEKNNLFGLKAYDNSVGSASGFSKPQDSILDFTKGYISLGYANPKDWRNYGGFLGNKYVGANVKYASDPYWGSKAVGYAVLAEYEMAGKNISKMKDYDYYQLAMFTKEGNIINGFGNELYKISKSLRVANQSHIGSVAALVNGSMKNKGGADCYEIYPERTVPIESDFTGLYEWTSYGYVRSSNVKFINKGKTGPKSEDVNNDGKVDEIDIELVSSYYNIYEGQALWNPKYDLNSDGVIDIYDIVKVSKNL